MPARAQVPAPRSVVPGGPWRTTKRALLVLSHAMERALAAGEPGLVLALFQQRSHFDVEAARYADLAAAGHTVVVVFDGPADGLPPGVCGVRVVREDPLYREWSLVLLSGQLGTALVAHDSRRLAPGERSLQASRVFEARWSFRRPEAAREAQRLLAVLGERLPVAVLAAAQAQVAASLAEPESGLEVQLAAVAEHLVASVDAGARREVLLQAELSESVRDAERDHLTGLHNRRFLERFLGRGDVADTSALLVDLDGLKTLNDELGHLAGDAALTAVATALRSCSRQGDVVARWGGDEFVLLLPGLDEGAALALANRLTAEVAGCRLPARWGGRALSVSVGVCGLGDATLPMARLDEALSAAKAGGKGRVRLASATG